MIEEISLTDRTATVLDDGALLGASTVPELSAMSANGPDFGRSPTPAPMAEMRRLQPFSEGDSNSGFDRLASRCGFEPPPMPRRRPAAECKSAS